MGPTKAYKREAEQECGGGLATFALHAGKNIRWSSLNGTPGGIREPAKLAMSSRPLADRNPRPSGSKNDARVRNNVYLHSAHCEQLQGAA